MNIARKHLSVRQDRTRRSRCHTIAVLCLALSLQAIVVLEAGCTLTSDGEIGIAQGAGTSLCPPLSDAPIDVAPYDGTVFGTAPSYRAPIAGDEEGPHGAPSVTPPAAAHAALNWPFRTLVPADGLGKTPGSFAVGDSDGAAIYSIPIQVVPGRAGMQPELAILYHSDKGNGLLGVGFSLQGLSSIARCGRTYADDDTLHGVTLTPDDRFCLDGQRLVAVSGAYGADGTEYRTSPDAFVKVVSHGGSKQPNQYTGPNSFTVYTKSGLKLMYGGSTSSAKVLTGNVARSWALRAAHDRVGNSMEIEYERISVEGGTVEHYPKEIRYGGHVRGVPHSRSVQFEYEARPDVLTRYTHGLETRVERRLRQIEVTADPDSTLVRRYDLTYSQSKGSGQSLLEAVTECTTGKCKRPTRFGWSEAEAGFGGGIDATATTPKADESLASQVVVMDMNGDGRDDIVYPDRERWNFALGVDAGWGETQNVHLPKTYLTSTPSVDEHQAGHYQRGFPIDYNQDGKTDLLLADVSPTWRVLESTGIGFQIQDTGIPRSLRSFMILGPWFNLKDYLTAGIYLVDLNGDGIKDLFEFDFWPGDDVDCLPDAPEICGGQWGYRLHDGRGFGPRVTIPDLDGTSIAMPVVPLDVDADGAQELLLFRCTHYGTYIVPGCGDSGQQYQILRWRKQPHSPDGSVTLTNSGIDESLYYQETLVPVDVNGDGLKDIVASNSFGDTGRNSLLLWINNGQSFMRQGTATASGFAASQYHLKASLVVDYDGDGREDLLIPYEFDDVVEPPLETWPPDDKYKKFFLLRAAPSGRAFVVEDPGLPYEPAPDEQTHASWPSRQGPRIADIDGDGLHDLVTIHQGNFRVRLHRAPHGGRPDAIVSIRDGGNDFDHSMIGQTQGGSAPPTVAIHYAPLIRSYSPSMTLEHGTDPDAVYFLRAGAGALCSYPCKRFVGPKYVVAQHLEDVSTEPGSLTGATNRRLTAHSYEDAFVDRHGRGWLGFRAHVRHTSHTDDFSGSVDGYPVSRSGVWTRTVYDPTTFDAETRIYPYAGRPSLTLTFGHDSCGPDPSAPSGMWLSMDRATWTVRSTNGGASHFVYQNRVQGSDHECMQWTPLELGRVLVAEAILQAENLPFRATDSERDVDNFGNPTTEAARAWAPSVDVVTPSTTTVTTYDNHTDSWLIGLRRVVTTTDVGAEGAQVRTSETIYDTTTGLPTRITKGHPGEEAHWLDTRLDYDDYGNVERSTAVDAHGVTRQIVYTYEPDGTFLHAMRDGLGHTTRFKYHPYLGELAAVVDPNGHTTWSIYDAFGNLRREHRPDGSSTTHWLTREQVGAEWLVTAHAQETTGATSATRLDRLGRPFWVQRHGLRGQVSETLRRYWGFGGVRAESLPYGAGESPPGWTEHAYDRRRRPASVVEPDGVTTSMTYAGTRTTVTNGRAHQSTVIRDGRGQVVRAEDARHETKEYHYGPFGRLLRITDARGDALVQVVDAYGRVTEAWNPDSGVRSFVYDAFDQVRSETDNKEQTTLYCHDEVGRSTVRQDVDGLTQWTYDEGPHAVGKLVRMSSPDGVIVQVDYDEAGRPWRETTELPGPSGGSESFAIRRVYNARGELLRVAYPATDDDAPFAVVYRYDDYGHLTAMEEPATSRTLWRWEMADAANRITRERFGNRVTTWRKYVPATGLLDESRTSWRALIPRTSPEITLQRLSYGYDENRNVERRTDHLQGLTETFEYDELDRLENVYLGDGVTPLYHYEYDDFGNITYKSDVGSYEYDGARPHAVRHANGKTYEYDANGNQTVRPIDVRGAGNASATITYTPFDKPRRIDAEHGPTTYEYDGDRQRARKVSPAQITTYVGGLYERHEHTAGGVTHKMHVMGPEGVIAVKTIAVDAAGEEKRSEHYLHPGHDGSAGVITSELGAVVERRSYDPFGQRRNPDWATGGPPAAPPSETIGFTGHEDEEDRSLINMRGRIYDPALGRFLSADPFVQAPFFSQSLNRYSYAFNNPLSFVDPTGYQAKGKDTPPMPTSDNCVPGPGCVRVEVGPVVLPGVEDDPASGEPFGHRKPGPPGLGVDLSLDVSDLRPGYALWSRWNPYSPLGQAGRDVFGEERPLTTWSLSPAMTRAVMGVIPVAGMSSLMAFSDPYATPRDKAIAVALDALTVVGVGVLVKLAGKVVGGASKAQSAARAGVEALEESVGAARGIAAGARVNMPAWRKIAIDMDEVASGHMVGGRRLAPGNKKDIFPVGMTETQVERAIRHAYRRGEVLHSQGADRVFVRGPFGSGSIEMWVNKTTKQIETAWPKF
ncbi:FG-GAP-like repeat-containing protein [Sorangium sp. So ce260]|uniref:FG-GAP-like repeat-containing protein n=1 Tax=Sorangium sp. So ce260 TaxID=3133291 RepID=UPI003F6075AB